MFLYVVVSNMMFGKEAVIAFSKEDDAPNYIYESKVQNKKIGGGPATQARIERHYVHGYHSDELQKVYALHEYLIEYDVFFLQGLYTTKEEANKVSFEKSQILEIAVK